MRPVSEKHRRRVDYTEFVESIIEDLSGKRGIPTPRLVRVPLFRSRVRRKFRIALQRNNQIVIPMYEEVLKTHPELDEVVKRTLKFDVAHEFKHYEQRYRGVILPRRFVLNPIAEKEAEDFAIEYTGQSTLEHWKDLDLIEKATLGRFWSEAIQRGA